MAFTFVDWGSLRGDFQVSCSYSFFKHSKDGEVVPPFYRHLCTDRVLRGTSCLWIFCFLWWLSTANNWHRTGWVFYLGLRRANCTFWWRPQAMSYPSVCSATINSWPFTVSTYELIRYLLLLCTISYEPGQLWVLRTAGWAMRLIFFSLLLWAESPELWTKFYERSLA